MKFALDRYAVGKEREILASEFYGIYIHNKNTRFSCPECRETVLWRKRSWDGSKPEHFYHLKKTESTPECDKRVDGNSELTLCERVGLPLYLKREIGNSYKLYLGFFSLGKALLQRAFDNRAQLKISSGTSWGCQERSFSINPTNFYEDQTTLIPLDFIPPNGHNYSISYLGATVSKALYSIWSDYVDGFSSTGAIFSYSESGGKKIRRGDSISTEKDYYLVARQFSPHYSEISNNIVGTIYLNSQSYNVYVIRINVSTNNPIQFEKVGFFLKSNFGVSLLEKSPAIITLWPPVIENDRLIPALPSKKIYCSVKSGNDMPSVYIYDDASALPVTVRSDSYGNHTVSLRYYSSEIAASVDRKYVGSEIIYQNRQYALSQHCYLLSVSNTSGNTFNISVPLPASVIKDSIYITLNAKAELYHKNRDERYQHISVRNADSINILALNIHDHLLIYVESRRIFDLFFEKPEYSTEQFCDLALVRGLVTSAKGIEVSTPSWVRQLIKLSNELGYNEFAYILMHITACGRLKIGTLRYLADIKGAITSV